MIPNVFLAIFDGILSVLTFPIASLADASLPTDFSDAIGTLSTYLSALDVIFPVSTLLTILAFYMIIEEFIFVFKAFQWILKKIPGLS